MSQHRVNSNPPQPDITRTIAAIIFDVAYKAQQGFDKSYKLPHDYTNKYMDEAVHKLITLVNEARIDEVEKVKLVTYRSEMVRYADKRIKVLKELSQ